MMEDKVLSIGQMKHLRELGVDTTEASAVLMLYTENGKELGWDEVENHGKDKPLYEWYDAETETWESANIRIYDSEMGDYDHSYREECGTFTLQDMLEMMPHVVYHSDINEEVALKPHDAYDMYYFKLLKHSHEYEIQYYGYNGHIILVHKTEKTILETTYKMLCWLAENNLLGKEE